MKQIKKANWYFHFSIISVIFAGVLVIIVLLLAGCSANPFVGVGALTGNNYSPTVYNNYPDNDDTVEPDNSDDLSNYFYFSYDDSASTVAVELLKYDLDNDYLPPSSLSRPWEFLNYENFSSDSNTFEDLGMFNVSMGLTKRDSLDNTDCTEYQLGVFVESPTITKQSRKNVVLTLIIDISGSMDAYVEKVEEVTTSRLDLVKYALAQLEHSLKSGDILNLVTFESSAKIVLQSVQFDEMSSIFMPTVNNLRTGGSTNLDDGIKKGYTVAQQTFDSSKMNRVIILTDAYANQGEVDSSIISQHTKINNQEGIYFSGVGISADFNEAFLNELTEAGRGAYYTLVTKRDARRDFNERLIGLLSVAAKDVRFRLDYPGDFTHIITASEESSTNKEEVQPTNFSYNTNQYFYEVFDTSTDINENTATIKLTIYYSDPETHEEKTEIITKSISALSGHQHNNIKNAEVIYLTTQLLAKKIEYSKINAILSAYYSTYSSPLFDEYKGYLNKISNLNRS